MATTTSTSITPALIVKSIAISGTTEGSLMRVTVQVLPELFVGTITLAKGALGQETSGKFKKGMSAKKPGSADATIGSELYDFIVAQSAAGAKLTLELEYTIEGAVLTVFVGFL